MDRQSIIATFGIPNSPGGSRSPNNNSSRRDTSVSLVGGRSSSRYSVTALYSIAAEQDVEVEDDLSKGRFLKTILHVILILHPLSQRFIIYHEIMTPNH